MDTTIDQHVAMDEALVPTAQRLKIGWSNFCLLSDIKSKESTLQLVYDVLRICPFFKAFLTHISQPSSSGADEETGSKLGVLDVPTDESEEELSWNSTDDEGDDNEEKDDDGDEEDEGDNSEEGNGDDDNDEDDDGRDDNQEYDDEYTKETRDEESFDPIPQTPENSKDEGNGEEDLSLNICEEERHIEEEDEDELYKDVNINQGMGLQASLEV
nr:hypothetical protein [Tanacetum cinerariifolium]